MDVLVSLSNCVSSYSDIILISNSYICGYFQLFAATTNNYAGIKEGLIGVGAGTAATGCLGAGIGQGFSSGKACEAIGRNPEAIGKIRSTMIIGAAIAESGAIYSLLIAIILLFVYK